MKILQIGYFDPYKNFGGIEKYIKTLALGLHNFYGYEVDMLVAGTANNKTESEFGKVITLKVPFFRSKLFFLPKYFYGRKARKFINSVSGEYDIFHFHGDNGLIGKNYAVKTILTLHGISLTTSSVAKRIFSLLPSRIEKNNVMMAQIVLSVSREAAEFFKRVSNSSVKVIKATVDTAFYKPLPSNDRLSIRKEFGLKGNTIIGIIVGTDPVRKGLLTAINAVENVNAPTILLLGIGFPAVVTDSARYVHMGKVDENTKLKFLQIADFFIFPSIKEGFPISVLEAAAVGLPLIVSKNCGVSELKALVPYFDEVNSIEPESYTIAIERFVEVLKKNGESIITNERSLLEPYSIEAEAETYSNIYESLLKHNQEKHSSLSN